MDAMGRHRATLDSTGAIGHRSGKYADARFNRRAGKLVGQDQPRSLVHRDGHMKYTHRETQFPGISHQGFMPNAFIKR